MFQILFEHNNEKFVKQCSNVLQKERYLQKLNARGIGYTLLGETQPQLCGCVFNVGGKIYTYVRVEGDAEPGNSAEVEVVDNFGNCEIKEVVVLWARETTIEECRQKAASLGRTKLSRIKNVWQRT